MKVSVVSHSVDAFGRMFCEGDFIFYSTGRGQSYAIGYITKVYQEDEPSYYGKSPTCKRTYLKVRKFPLFGSDRGWDEDITLNGFSNYIKEGMLNYRYFGSMSKETKLVDFDTSLIVNDLLPASAKGYILDKVNGG